MAVTEYDAFVSYSHDDAPLAEALQDGLQRFSKPWYRRRPFLRVCRDETSFGAGHDLGQRITSALDGSGHLVLLLSPTSAASPWVDNEVAHFLDAKGPEHITFVIDDWPGDGRPGGNLNGFAWDGDDVPPSVRGRIEEPLAVDMRWTAGAAAALTLDNERFSDDVATIAAAIKGMSKDELIGAVVAMRTRARILTGSLLLGALILLTAIAVAVPGWLTARSAQRAAESAVEEAEARLDDLNAQLATTADALEAREADLRRAEADLDDAEGRLADAEANLQSVQSDLASTTEERDLAEAARDVALSERDAAADARDQAVSERDAAADARDQALAERDAAADARDEALAERDAAADARDEALAERDAAADARDAAVAARDLAVGERDAAQTQRDAAELARRDAEVQLRLAEGRLDAAEASLADAESNLRAVEADLASTSAERDRSARCSRPSTGCGRSGARRGRSPTGDRRVRPPRQRVGSSAPFQHRPRRAAGLAVGRGDVVVRRSGGLPPGPPAAHRRGGASAVRRCCATVAGDARRSRTWYR